MKTQTETTTGNRIAGLIDEREKLQTQLEESQNRLVEINGELKNVLGELHLNNGGKKGAPRGPRGETRSRIVEVLTANPGQTNSQIAKALDKQPPAISPTIKKMVEDGVLKRDGFNYSLAKPAKK